MCDLVMKVAGNQEYHTIDCFFFHVRAKQYKKKTAHVCKCFPITVLFLPYIFLFLSYNLIKRIGCDETNVCMTHKCFVSVDLLYACALSVLTCFFVLKLNTKENRKTHTFQKCCSNFSWEKKLIFISKESSK